MRTALWVAVYGIGLYAGIRAMLGKGNGRDIVWYVLILGWCAYLSLGKLYGWPLLTAVSPLNAFFLPAGKWIVQLMGGLPSE
ncbi:hypothetical protein [Paenibacillus sp. HJGM_3]|uniref:hypothetical protein n=1 Tax=Paenibacillus sp. HJGM_3 TaxID=3379816 RepID=UPI00385FC166